MTLANKANCARSFDARDVKARRLPDASMVGTVVNSCIALVALGIAFSLRPWRSIGSDGPPWTWIVVWAATPLLWSLDSYSSIPVLPPMSGAALLVLLAGWPLAVIAFLPVAAAIVLTGEFSWVEALQRLLWLGIVPATLVLGIGAAVRRWLPNHLFVYIMGRGFFGTFGISTLASCAALALNRHSLGGSSDFAFVASVLLAFGEAALTGALVASLVAFRPQLLATYSDGLYLPGRNNLRFK